MAAVKNFTAPDSTLPLMGDTEVISCVNFSYTDPVSGDQAVNQGVVFTSQTGSRVIFRLSGTGSSGATVRIYLEYYSTSHIEGDVQEILSPLVKFALQVSDIRAISGREVPTVIT
jgi:phosphoglucomutase